MASSINWNTLLISVPQTDLSFVSGSLYSHDTKAFWDEMKSVEASEVGMPFDDIILNVEEITIAGTTYSRSLQIVNGYTIEWEDGQYAVRLDNSNNNFFDEGVIDRNQVSVIPTNSAGLQTVDTGGGGGGGDTGRLV